MSLVMNMESKMPGYYVIALGGRLDQTTYADCEERINPILIPATKMITFDMADLNYISSMGLRIFLNTRKIIEGNGGSISLIKVQPQIEKVFEIANLLKGMKLFASIQEADDYFDAMQKKVLGSMK